MKTGSTSIFRGLLGGQKNVIGRSFGDFPREWESLPSFAIVRNPFDRFLSAWHMFKTYDVRTPKEETFRANLTVNDILEAIADRSIPLNENNYISKLRLHFAPMTHPVHSVSKAKHIGRFESYEKAFRDIESLLGFETGPVHHKRKTTPRNYREVIDPELRAKIEAVYAEDLETFGYSW
ncbi:MAG: hypothetical protein C0617_13250 [Desulfuromonas sp.]|nr:MAG: hypothetical protein C0617_13250 [Desulfuromonas sp.]